MHQNFTEEEFAHFLLPRAKIINSYVVEDPTTHAITDMLSFYHLPSTVLKSDKHKMLYAAYSYYSVPGKHTIKDLIEDALVLAKAEDIDVFNALDLMENGSVMKELKFGPGDGHLQYYLYNWSCPATKPHEVGIVLH